MLSLSSLCPCPLSLTKQIAELFDQLLEEKLPGTLQRALEAEGKAHNPRSAVARTKRKSAAAAVDDAINGPNCRVRLGDDDEEGEEAEETEKEKSKVFEFNFSFE